MAAKIYDETLQAFVDASPELYGGGGTHGRIVRVKYGIKS